MTRKKRFDNKKAYKTTITENQEMGFLLSPGIKSPTLLRSTEKTKKMSKNNTYNLSIIYDNRGLVDSVI